MPEINSGESQPSSLLSYNNEISFGEILTYNDLKRLEKENVIAVLHKTNWKFSGSFCAAEILGIKPTTLASGMKALGIKKNP